MQTLLNVTNLICMLFFIAACIKVVLKKSKLKEILEPFKAEVEDEINETPKHSFDTSIYSLDKNNIGLLRIIFEVNKLAITNEKLSFFIDAEMVSDFVNVHNYIFCSKINYLTNIEEVEKMELPYLCYVGKKYNVPTDIEFYGYIYL